MNERNGRGAGDPHGGKWTQGNCTSSGGRAQGERYAEAALAGIFSELVNSGGGRNAALNKAAFQSGTLVGAGLKDRAAIEARLLQAGTELGLDQAEARATVRSGLEAGIRNPREIDLDSDTRSRGAARPVATRPPPRQAEDHQARARLIATWRASIPLDHPGAEPARRYLEARGLGAIVVDLPGPGVVRCHPALPYFEAGREIGRFPALVAVVRDVTGRAVTIHRVYLTADGRKAPVPAPKKLMSPICRGATHGAAIQLYPAGDFLGVAEGLETALAVRAATGQPVWATISASGMAGLALPPTIREVFIWADKDANGVGQQAAMTLAKKLTAEGRKASICLPPGPIPEGKGLDWLDVFQAMRRAA
ncbi:MAG: toprim domain-containing protein [Magnetococcales bacterium]|nr:toprim domain-containing protein [Magnetococcales bacterium]